MADAGHTPEHKEGGDAHLKAATGNGDSHAVDAHGHGHDDSHAAAGDIIPETSIQDTLLKTLALLAGVALVGLIVYWIGLKPAELTEGEPVEHHEVQQAAPANTEPAPVR
jgi:hypothetical protein